MTCPQCRKEIAEENVRVCPFCGYSAEEDSPQMQKKSSAKPLLAAFGIIGCLFILAGLIWFIAGGEDSPSRRNPYAKLNGAVYTGTYIHTQGLTALDFTVEKTSRNGEWHAVFSFYAHPDNPGVPSGSYQMIGKVVERFNDGTVKVAFTGTEWISRPDNYYFVDFTGVFSADGKALTSTDCFMDLKRKE